MREDIVVAGLGGQGVILASMVIAWAGLYDGKRVVQIPSYGPKIRGGTANGTTVISTSEIYSPVTEHPTSVIVMNEPSLKKFVENFPNKFSVIENGLVVINASVVKRKCTRKGIQIIRVNANEIAERVGSLKAANMVVLGAYFEKRKILSWDSIFKGLEEYLSNIDKSKFLALNKKALEAGAKATRT